MRAGLKPRRQSFTNLARQFGARDAANVEAEFGGFGA
jgi:hypothetical protein